MRRGRKNTTLFVSLILPSHWCKHWTQSIENHFSDFVSEWALITGQLLRALLVIKSLQCEWQKELTFLFSLLRCSKTAIWYLVKYRWALSIFFWGALVNYADNFAFITYPHPVCVHSLWTVPNWTYKNKTFWWKLVLPITLFTSTVES